MSKNAQECPSQAWVLPFKGSDLFALTSMVMSNISIEVIHMYVSVAMKLFYNSLDFIFIMYQQLIKANVNSFMCDVLLMDTT